MSDIAHEVVPAYPLHDYQRQVLYDLLDAVVPSRTATDGGRAIAHMPTGAGKTRVACHVASVILNQRPAEGKVVVWLASSEELCEQAAESLESAWSYVGNRPVSIQRYWGKTEMEIGDVQEGFLIAGLPKLWAVASQRQGFLAPLSQDVAGVIFDEAHQAVAPTYSFITEQLVSHGPPLIGLTATPGRTYRFGEADEQLTEMFDHTRVSIDAQGHENPMVYLIKQQYLAEPEYVTISINVPSITREPRDGFDYTSEDLRALGRSAIWREAIVSTTKQAMQRHHRTIVFCPSVGSATSATAQLQQEGFSVAMVVADTPADERGMIINQFRSEDGLPMALLNFGVLTTGFDAPRTSCAVIARPTSSLVLYSQMVGRAIRGKRSGGNRRCTIYTIVGPEQQAFGSVADEFTHWEELWNPPTNS